MEDKVEESNQSVKDNEKFQENTNGTCKTSRTLPKDQTYKSWV
jgi:hypothetical protein